MKTILNTTTHALNELQLDGLVKQISVTINGSTRRNH